ncbi:cytochrome P450 [Streptomyces sp. NRRL F-5126]|uniref:cytochrome P450 n=1 Tax=Streptomyces sp. NRRL F-5126 TaxID=1463857 RepID=UPI0004CB6FC5|nr:cytochrome P450 [Streptomyces sp. NRRL F-5126]
MTETVPNELADQEFPVARGCPFAEPEAYARLREREPISRVRLRGGEQAWWVSGYAESRAVMADRRFSSDRRRDNYPNPGGDPRFRERFRHQRPPMVSLDGAEHTAARRAVIGEFTVKRLAALRPRIQEIVDGFIDEMLAAESHPVDLVRTLSLPVSSLVICELLGVPYADHDYFQSCAAALTRRTASPEERLRGADGLRTYLADLLTRKEAEPGDDLFSRQIAQQREEGALDREGLVSTANSLLLAGHETTANMISLGVLALLEHPDQLALIQDDPDKTLLAVDELLRYLTIADSVILRVATEDVEIGGVTVKADEGVVVCGLSANRDPAAFENPGELDVLRGARHHIAFGYGPHQCLGQNLARLELRIVFDTLFRRIPGLRLAEPVDAVPFKVNASVYGAHELPVTW